MITKEEALKHFKNKYSDLKPVQIGEIIGAYVIVAVKDINNPGYDEPFYAIDKSDGTIYSYLPSNDEERDKMFTSLSLIE